MTMLKTSANDFIYMCCSLNHVVLMDLLSECAYSRRQALCFRIQVMPHFGFLKAIDENTTVAGPPEYASTTLNLLSTHDRILFNKT